MVKIISVESKSYAEKAGIQQGDFLISINGSEIQDVLDYRFYLADSDVKILLQRSGNEYSVHIQKEEYDDIGLDFETPLMDEKHTCKNGCIFCFIDQNPKGLRESLYFKDDDSRLSFLHGNYITLTNMTDEDVERIVKMRFSPINISVHTTNPELRVKMMKNKRSGEVLKYLNSFKEAGLSMCAQIVLCRGINDGDELIRSMNDLAEFFPQLISVAVVPAGLTRFRDKLYPLSDFSSKEAARVIDVIDSFGKKHKKKHGTRLIYAADEFYLKAGRPIPKADYYEDYSQLDNGVGMLRSFFDEFNLGVDCLTKAEFKKMHSRKISVATGVAAFPTISKLAHRLEKMISGLSINVYEIKNRFFGESITVSGLLTGVDIMEQLSDKELGEELLLPKNCLKHGEQVFLCGTTVDELSERLGVSVRICDNDGQLFVDALLGI